MSRIQRVIPLVMMALLVGSLGCAQIDPQADQTLRRMSDTLADVERFSFHATITIDMPLETGQLVQYEHSRRAVVVRPDKLFVESVGDDVDRAVWYDGRTLTVLVKTTNTYAQVDVPGRLETMLDYVVDTYDLTVPLAELLFRSSYDALIANVQHGRSLGVHTIGDRPCHHLAFRQQNINWQIWIDTGDVALPTKLVITHKDLPGQPQDEAMIDQWDFAPEIPDDQFTFVAPSGATQVPMKDLLGRSAE